MKRLIALSAFSLLSSCSGCERTPSELRPGFDSLVLPSNFCSGENEPISLLVRNIGDDPVNLKSAVFEAVAGSDADLENFDDPAIEGDKLLADEVGFVRFTYRTPGGTGQKALLVIESDAAENPTLEVPVEATEFIPENRDELCNPGGEGEGEVGEGEGEVGRRRRRRSRRRRRRRSRRWRRRRRR